MKYMQVTTIAALVLVGCGESKQNSIETTNKDPLGKEITEPLVELTELIPPVDNIEPLIPFWAAVREGNYEALKQHLNNDLNLNDKDEYGLVSLHYASNFGYLKIIDLLIKKGADVNLPAKNGWTPIDWAGPHKETISLLRKHGAKKGEDLKTKAN